MSQCKFDNGWGRHCNQEAGASGFCEEHNKLKCVSCGKQATKSCDQTGGLVCGAPLCPDCVHNTHPGGTNGLRSPWPIGMKSHVPKDQV